MKLSSYTENTIPDIE